MKRMLGISLLVTGLVAGSFAFDTVAPVQKAQAAGKTIMFDNSHCETCGNSDWVINGAYSTYAQALRNAGYNVVENTSPISATVLTGVDVLVLPEPNTNLTSTEKSAINSFVKTSGKGLFVISDHGNSDRNSDGWDSTEIFNGYLYGTTGTDWVGSNFGFSVNYVDKTQEPITDIRSHAMMTGVSQLAVWNGATFAITNSTIAKGLAYVTGDTTNPYVVASTPGVGRVAAIGDSSPFNDGTPLTSCTTYNSWPQYNISTFGVNAIKWLAKDI